MSQYKKEQQLPLKEYCRYLHVEKGMALRDIGLQIGKSHEWVRLAINSISPAKIKDDMLVDKDLTE